MLIVCNGFFQTKNHIIAGSIGKLFLIDLSGVIVLYGLLLICLGIHPPNPGQICLWNRADLRSGIKPPPQHYQKFLPHILHSGSGRLHAPLGCQQCLLGAQHLCLCGKTISPSCIGAGHGALSLQEGHLCLSKLQLAFCIIYHITLSHCDKSLFCLLVIQINNLAVIQVIICLLHHIFSLNLSHKHRIHYHSVHRIIRIRIIHTGINLICHVPILGRHIILGIPIFLFKFV